MGWGVPVRQTGSALALLATLGASALACNALIGTPDPSLADDGGANDASGPRDATIQDAQGAHDAPEDETSAADTGNAGDAGDTGAVSDAGDSEDAGGAGADAGDAADVVDAPDAPDVEDAPDADDASDTGTVSSSPPSCVPDGGPGVSTCGVLGDSCCTSLEVPGGAYKRSFNATSDAGPTNAATVSTFRLDEYEATVGRFRQFVQATKAGWTPPIGSGLHAHLNGGLGLSQPLADGGVLYEQGWMASYDANLSEPDGGSAGTWDVNLGSCTPATWTPSPAGQEDLPVVCLNWYEAYAFCIWDGGFLPSEAEWEYAAAGGSAQREYPWGSTDPGLANQYANYGCEYPEGGLLDGSFTCSSVTNIAPVGTMPMGAGAWHQLDLAGNVHEETIDTYATSYVLPCHDCADLTPTGFMAARGGSFVVPAAALVTYARFDYPPWARSYKGGVRCARSP